MSSLARRHIGGEGVDLNSKDSQIHRSDFPSFPSDSERLSVPCTRTLGVYHDSFFSYNMLPPNDLVIFKKIRTGMMNECNYEHVGDLGIHSKSLLLVAEQFIASRC